MEMGNMCNTMNTVTDYNKYLINEQKIVIFFKTLLSGLFLLQHVSVTLTQHITTQLWTIIKMH